MKKTKLFAIVSIIICTLFAVLASACAHALDVPTGWTIDENLVLSWAGVEDARNSLIEIKNSLLENKTLFLAESKNIQERKSTLNSNKIRRSFFERSDDLIKITP